MLTHKPDIQIRNICSEISSIIKRNIGRNIKQLSFLFCRSNNGTAEFSYIVKLVRFFRKNILGCFIRSSITTGYPNYNDIFFIKNNGFNNGIVQWLYKMAITHKFLQNSVNFTLFHSFDRKNRTSVNFFHANDNISTANVVYIIRECTNAVDNWIRIPISLIFNSCRFHNSFIDQIFNIYRYCHIRLLMFFCNIIITSALVFVNTFDDILSKPSTIQC